MTPTVRVYIKASIIFSILLDVLCYKYRNLANFIIYLESFNSVAYQIVPTQVIFEMRGWIMALLQFLIFIVFYCDKGAQIVFNTIMLTLRQVLPMIQLQQVDKSSVITQVTYSTLLYFILCNALALLVTYVQELGANLF